MSNTKFIPRFISMPITYRVVLDGITILATKDYSFGIECCLSWRKNHPRSNPRRIRLVEERLCN